MDTVLKEPSRTERSGKVGLGKLFYLIGLPGSGKSTVANKFVVDKIKDGVPTVIIGGDDFRKSITSKEFVPEAEGLVFASMDIAIRALLDRGFHVIVDETSTTKETLKRYYRLDINAQPVYVEADVEECISRVIANGKYFLVEPIRRMSKQLDKLMSNFQETINEIKKEIKQRKVQDVNV